MMWNHINETKGFCISIDMFTKWRKKIEQFQLANDGAAVAGHLLSTAENSN